MEWIFNKMDHKWTGLEQKWIGSQKLDFLPTPSYCLSVVLPLRRYSLFCLCSYAMSKSLLQLFSTHNKKKTF